MFTAEWTQNDCSHLCYKYNLLLQISNKLIMGCFKEWQRLCSVNLTKDKNGHRRIRAIKHNKATRTLKIQQKYLPQEISQTFWDWARIQFNCNILFCSTFLRFAEILAEIVFHYVRVFSDRIFRHFFISTIPQTFLWCDIANNSNKFETMLNWNVQLMQQHPIKPNFTTKNIIIAGWRIFTNFARIYCQNMGICSLLFMKTHILIKIVWLNSFEICSSTD